MKYYSSLPITAILAFTLMNLLVLWQIIPPGLELLEHLKGSLDDYFYFLLMMIILAESIVYVGFYFPGQFFAVLLVVSAKPSVKDIIVLTLAMVSAATIGSAINYGLGYLKSDNQRTAELQASSPPTKKKHLLLAMIHMNSLAFFMFSQGINRKPFKLIFLAGVLNLPYYLIIIATTVYLSDEVMQVAENTVLMYSLMAIWLVVTVALDIKKRRQR